MSLGLIALLDDVAGLAKVAAASLDDVGVQAAKAGAKAAGLVIDDAAVTPRYVVGFSPARELPIVARIAVGSLRNKLLFLLPGALFLSFVAAWAITPLLMLGGAYLCYEGVEKVSNAFAPHGGNKHGVATLEPEGLEALEDAKVRGAIGTDFILSAEIMAITLGALADVPLWEQAVVLAIVGVGITLGVYGVVALIVKADDAGLAMAAWERPVSAILRRREASPSGLDRAIRPVTQAIGRGLVLGVPWLLKALAIVGTAAMVWVGGGIIVHGLAGYGLQEIEHAIQASAAASAAFLPVMSGVASWIVTAAGSGLVGLTVGAVLIAAMHFVIAPLVRRVRNRRAVRNAA